MTIYGIVVTDKFAEFTSGECLLILNTLQFAEDADTEEKQQAAIAAAVRYLIGRGVCKKVPGSELDLGELKRKVVGKIM